jgi:hypothetical protein
VKVHPEFADTSRYTFPAGVREAVREVCVQVQEEMPALLPALSRRVEVLVVAGDHGSPEIGSTGSSVAPRLVVWTVDPNRPEGVVEIVNARLRHALFHEFHHLARGWLFYGGEPVDSFMDGVICEGLATAFERDEAESVPPWGQYDSQVESWVLELMALPKDAPYGDWMFRHPDGRRWIGYRAGTHIADRAIKRGGRSAAELVNTPSAEILSMAGIAEDAP